MKSMRQAFVFLCVLAAGLYIWIAYVPAAQPFLQRTGLYDLLGIKPAQSSAAEQGGGWRGGGATDVIVARVSERAQTEQVSALGDGRARRSVTVRSNAVGVIKDLALVSGGYVEAGSSIVKLEDENEQIALEQAKITLENARAEAERISRLQSSGTISAVRLREVELALRSAELGLRQAEFNLAQRQILAPFSGWVGIINLEEGDRVNAQDVLVVLTDRSYILIDFRVPEHVVTKIKVGQSFDVRPVGVGDQPLKGEIRAIDSVVDRASRTLLVRGHVPNDADALRAGMAFSISLSFPGDTVLSIAPLAVQWSSEGPFVWVVRDGKAMRAPVVLEQRASDEVLVTSSLLKAGDIVVTEGVQSLRDGAEVTPVNLEAEAREPAPEAGADQ